MAPGAWGAVLAIESAGAVVGAIFALRVKFDRPLVASQLLVVPAGILLMSLAFPLPLPVIGVTGFLTGIGFAFGGAIWDSTLQRFVPEHALSRISSFDWLGSVALNPLGYALIGPLAVAFGTEEMLLIAGVLNILTCIGVVLIPSVYSLRASAAPVTAATESAA